MVTPNDNNNKRKETLRVFIPVLDLEKYSAKDRSPIAYETDDWMLMPGLTIVPPKTVVLLQMTRDKYDY